MGQNKGTSFDTFRVHSKKLPVGQSGELIHVTRETAAWEWMNFFVRRMVKGEIWEARSDREEMGLVLLGGRCRADWGEGHRSIGERAHVFDGLPYALYMPPGRAVSFEAETECELAVCSVPSSAKLEPRLITPNDVAVSLRGGGNASRQIVEVMRPEFPADKLMMIEVYTPSGNWSSYPPHKHDVHNPPAEVDLDEIYYFRTNQGAGYAYQRLYKRDENSDVTLTVMDGDVTLIKDGYHPVVAGHGYDLYYLNCLAGSERSLANSEDPDHVWVRSTWKDIDPRLPLVKIPQT
ncbi:MAG TPA: 5-deoxy-glucuronate isomerase [Terriglobia bacterium]|nr:5-deoxy-glucuronate isomerase [Terriglobia bacterium]